MESAATVMQDRLIGDALDGLDKGKDVFIVAPTGAGKSRKFCRIAADRAIDGDKVLVLTNRKTLVFNGQESMDKWADTPVRTSSGMNGKLDQRGQVVFSTVQTVHQIRDELPKYDLVILDEAHNALQRNGDYRETIEALERANPKMQLVAVSATPPELYKGMPERLVDAEKVIMTFEEAVAAKLVDLPVTKMPLMRHEGHESVKNVIDSKRRSSSGSEMYGGISKAIEKMRPDDWSEQLVDVYERHLADKRTLAFFDTIKEAKGFMEEARSRGHDRMEIMHSKRSTNANMKTIDDFRKGRIAAIVSVDMISEGVDVDANGILLDKKTTSSREYRQIIGRESRSHGTVRAEKGLLIDTGASTLMHGEIGAQAEMQTLRGSIERGSVSLDGLLPNDTSNGFKPWVAFKSPTSQRDVYATSLDGRIIYAADIEDRFAAFACINDKKGRRVELLAIDGERKGMPSRDGFGRWIGDAVRRNEQSLSRMLGNGKAGTTELARIVGEDWGRNATSIEKSIAMVQQYAPPVHALAQATARTAVAAR